jgi:hypothetical protein
MITALAVGSIATQAYALDVPQYKSLVAETITEANSGQIDADALIAKQQHLPELGAAGVREYTAENAASAPLLTFVADRAPSMTQLSLEEIEAQWREGAALHQVGPKIEDFEHFGQALSHMDLSCTPPPRSSR